MVESKQCLNCEKEYIPIKNSDRMKFCCKQCRLDYRIKTNYMKSYYNSNVDKWKDRQSKYFYKQQKNMSRNEKYRTDEKYIEYTKQRVRDYNKRNPMVKLNQHLEKYNMSYDDYKNMLNIQNGKCLICGSNGDLDKPYRPLMIDHNHTTGKVRGLLCSHCNFLIGQAKDDVKILKSAIKYLEENDYEG